MNNFYRAAFAALAIMAVVAILDTAEHYVPAVSTNDNVVKITAYEISQGSTTAVAPCDSSLTIKSTSDTIAIMSDQFEMVFKAPSNTTDATDIAAEICRDRQQS